MASAGARPERGARPRSPSDERPGKEAGRAGARRLTAGSLLATGIALASLSAWFYAGGPARVVSAEEAPLVLCLVDRSASVTRLRPDWAVWLRGELRREAEAARLAGEELAIVAYDRDASLLYAPGPPEGFLGLLEGRGRAPFDPRAEPGRDHRTGFGRAAQLVEPLLFDAERARVRVAYFGDGDGFEVRAGPVLEGWRRSGIAITAPPLPALARTDVRLARLVLPTELAEGVALVARGELELRGRAPRGPVAVELRVRDADGERTIEASLGAVRGAGPHAFRVDLGPVRAGRSTVEARLVLARDEDAVPENDAARGTVFARGRRVLGVLAAEGAEEAALSLIGAQAEAPPGLQLWPLDLESLSAELEHLDGLLSLDVSPADLPATALEAWLDSGGGWLAAGGYGLLGGWEAGRGAAALLPLVPDDGGEERDVLLVVDGSGSMEGEPFEAVRAALLAMARAAPPSSEIRLHFFTRRLHPAQLVRARGGGEDPGDVLRRLLEARVPGGSTAILSSLEALVERRTGAREALVLLLTDGREDDAEIHREERSAAILEGLAGTRTRLVTVAVGASADLGFLERLVAEGESLRRSRALEGLAELFQDEVNRERLVRDVAPRLAEGAPSEVERGWRDWTPPVLERLVVTRALPGAELLLEAPDGLPVLAAKRIGLGRSAVLPTSPSAGWAPELGRWTPGPAAERGLAGLLPWLIPGRERAGPRVVLDGRRLVVREETPADGAPVRRGRLVPAAGAGEALPLELVRGLGPDGRILWSATLPEGADGLAGATLWMDAEGGERSLGFVDLGGLGAREFESPPDWRLGPAPEGAPTRAAETRPGPHPAAPWALGAALLALAAATPLVGRGGQASTVPGR